MEAQEYIEKLEQRECSESNCHIAEIANSWAAGQKSGLEEGGRCKEGRVTATTGDTPGACLKSQEHTVQ